jgi:hypothetical protein
MTYVPKKVLERQKWWTFPEAISHIVEVEKCAQNSAWEQLRTALADEAIRYIYALFENQLESKDPSHWYKTPFPHLSAREFWTTTSIDLDSGRIYLHDTPVPRYIERVVWLFKESVLEIWKEQVAAVEENKEAASDDEMREALRAICREYKQAGKKIPNVLEAPSLIIDRLPSKWVLVKVAQGIAGEEEFKKQRLKAGHRPPRKL